MLGGRRDQGGNHPDGGDEKLPAKLLRKLDSS
jgi:hypothetical protein